MGNRSKAEWMSCFARSPSLNGFQAWVRLCMCCLAACVFARVFERVYVCNMHVHANLCVCSRVPLCLQVCLCASVFFFQPEKWIPTKTSPHNVAKELPQLQCELVVIVPCFLSSGSRSSGSRVTYLRDSSSSWSLWIRIGSRKSSAVKVHYVVLVRNLNRRGKIFIDNLFVFMTE